MYERLDKLRAEVDRLKARLEDDKVKLKAAEDKLKAAENAQIIADVGALNLTPEQLAQFLSMMQKGKLNGSAMVMEANTTYPSLKDGNDNQEDDDDEI